MKDDLYQTLRTTALTYPDAVEEAPWGHLVVKAGKKVFLFLGGTQEAVSLNLKLPTSNGEALEHSCINPMGYGMGKHGWVSMSLADGHDVGQEELLAWLDESFRAVATRKQLKMLESGERTPKPPPVNRADGKVLMLVGSDHLRRGRAQAALEERGAEVAAVGLDEALAIVGEVVPDGIMVDVTRDATQALALLGELSLASEGAVMAVAGVRDAKHERKVRELGEFELVSREAPGEHKVVEALAALLD